jgi:hypothetical protein
MRLHRILVDLALKPDLAQSEQNRPRKSIQQAGVAEAALQPMRAKHALLTVANRPDGAASHGAQPVTTKGCERMYELPQQSFHTTCGHHWWHLYPGRTHAWILKVVALHDVVVIPGTDTGAVLIALPVHRSQASRLL